MFQNPDAKPDCKESIKVKPEHFRPPTTGPLAGGHVDVWVSEEVPPLGLVQGGDHS